MKHSLAIVVAVALSMGTVNSQFFGAPLNLISHSPLQITPNYVQFADPNGQRNLAHHSVIENAAQEAQLPRELVNPFYKNPVIAARLAKESLITNKEFAVFNRETERIPRSEIFKIFEHAGFYDKNRRK